MPLYDYQCGKCSHKFEMRRSFEEGASACCPQCNNPAQRVFSPVPIVFKGPGLYVTDYRKEKPAPETAPDAACKTECKTEKSGGCDSSACKTCNNN